MQAAYRLYPVIALALLAGVSVWLERISRPEDAQVETRPQSGPDFTAESARIVGYGVDGDRRYELVAERIAHYPQGDTTQLALPRLTLYAEGRITRVSAMRGEVSPGGERVDLANAVRVRRDGEGSSGLSLDTETLAIWPDDHRAETGSPVELAQGRSTATALGMRANNLFGTLELIGQARVHMPRRQGKPS